MSGIISDSALLELERQRAALIDNLRDRGILISSDATMGEAVEKTILIGQNGYFEDFVQGNMEEVKLLNPSILNLGSYPFCSVRNTMTKLYMPYVRNIQMLGDSTIQLRNLQHLYAPNVYYLGGYYPTGFMPQLVNIILPNLTTIQGNGYGFIQSSDSLIRYIAPKLLANSGRVGTCNTVEIIDVQGLRYTDNLYTRNIETLILRSKSYASVLGGSAANYLPNIKEIYVPQSMLNTYQNATNWSAIADKFVALEDSEYEDEEWYKNTQWYEEEMAVWQ